MIKTQQASLTLKAELAARHEMCLEMESAKSVAVTQLQQTHEDLEVSLGPNPTPALNLAPAQSCP